MIYREKRHKTALSNVRYENREKILKLIVSNTKKKLQKSSSMFYICFKSLSMYAVVDVVVVAAK